MLQDCAISAALYPYQVLINERMIPVLPKLTILKKIKSFLNGQKPQITSDTLLTQ